jgi:hypothetical protein
LTQAGAGAQNAVSKVEKEASTAIEKSREAAARMEPWIETYEPPKSAAFECRQFLSFRFDKEIELRPAFGRAIRMIFRLMSCVYMYTRAFLATGDSDEIYFFNEDKTVLINKSSSTGHIIDIEKEFSDWKAIEVAM